MAPDPQVTVDAAQQLAALEARVESQERRTKLLEQRVHPRRLSDADAAEYRRILTGETDDA